MFRIILSPRSPGHASRKVAHLNRQKRVWQRKYVWTLIHCITSPVQPHTSSFKSFPAPTGNPSSTTCAAALTPGLSHESLGNSRRDPSNGDSLSLDQFHLPCAAPFLNLLLPPNRLDHTPVLLEVDELVNAVPTREPFHFTLPVFPHPSNEIIGHA